MLLQIEVHPLIGVIMTVRNEADIVRWILALYVYVYVYVWRECSLDSHLQSIMV